MQQPHLSSEQAEQIINLLRNNPGVEMTQSMIADETGIPIAELAAYLADLGDRDMVLHSTTPDGVDVYRFPPAYRSHSKIIGE